MSFFTYNSYYYLIILAIARASLFLFVLSNARHLSFARHLSYARHIASARHTSFARHMPNAFAHNHNHRRSRWFALPLQGAFTCCAPCAR